MGLFGGPSKQFLLQTAQGVASFILQHKQLSGLDEETQNQFVQNLRENGAPTNRRELVEMVSDFINVEKLGWYSQSQFLTMIYGCLISSGMPKSDAFDVREDIRIYYKLIGSK
jgi:hypothetical protein